MIQRYRINSKRWTAISTAGQSGTCWIERNIRGNGTILISHYSAGLPRKSYGFPLNSPADNIDICIISADDQSDVFYARVTNSRNIIDILVDVV